MRELDFKHSSKEMFRSKHKGMASEAITFPSQRETLKSFMMGLGAQEVSMSINGRREFWHRHVPGFANGQLRIAFFGAHPDDTALDTGLAYLLVKQGEVNNVKKTRLAVLSATPGQEGEMPEQLQGDLSSSRIQEDVRGTKRLRADFYANLGFLDGSISNEINALIERFSMYLGVLRPHIVLLPDPTDIVHEDHIAVSHAVLKALIKNKQNPIVAYTDFQNGDSKITEAHTGFALNNSENDIVRAAYLDHVTQTRVITRDVGNLLSRSQRRAELLDTEVPFLGIVRQDFQFSQKPLYTYLGDRVVGITNTETT